jgi:hypothetical protein
VTAAPCRHGRPPWWPLLRSAKGRQREIEEQSEVRVLGAPLAKGFCPPEIGAHPFDQDRRPASTGPARGPGGAQLSQPRPRLRTRHGERARATRSRPWAAAGSREQCKMQCKMGHGPLVPCWAALTLPTKGARVSSLGCGPKRERAHELGLGPN